MKLASKNSPFISLYLQLRRTGETLIAKQGGKPTHKNRISPNILFAETYRLCSFRTILNLRKWMAIKNCLFMEAFWAGMVSWNRISDK